MVAATGRCAKDVAAYLRWSWRYALRFGRARTESVAPMIDALTVVHSFPVWLPPTQNWMYNQARFLGPNGIDVHIVCEKTTNLDQFAGPRIHSLAQAPIVRRYWDKGLQRLRIRGHSGFMVSASRRIRARILHSHFGNVGWMDLGAARALGIPQVVTFYGFDVGLLPRRDPAWQARYATLFQAVDRVLCEGPHMAECIAAIGCPAAKIRVQHLGVCVEDIPFRPRERAEHDEGAQPPRIERGVSGRRFLECG